MRRADWLRAEPFTLQLSAGFFGFFAHTGFLMALEDEGVRPARLVGSSAGALAGGVWAAGVPAAVLAERLCRLSRREFWDPELPALGLLRGDGFARLLDEMLAVVGVGRVEATTIPFACTAYRLESRQIVSIEAGELNAAIRASCAVPLLFHPVRLDGARYIDAGGWDRAADAALKGEARVLLHHLPARSLWSKHRRNGIAAPTAGTTRLVLSIPGLARPGPFRLAEGELAFRQARALTRVWLAAPHASDPPPRDARAREPGRG